MKRVRKHPFIRGRWLIFFLLMIIPLLYFSRKVYKLLNSIYEINNLKKKTLILEAENEVLETRISEYKRGNLVEAKARNDLSMIKKNEKIYLILKK